MADNNWNVKMLGEDADPNLTIEVNNDEAEALLAEYEKKKTVEGFNTLVNKLHQCRVLVPSNITDKKELVPGLIKSPDGRSFLPIFTSKKQIPEGIKAMVIANVPFVAVLSMAVGVKEISEGIVINPFSHRAILTNDAVQLILNVDAQEETKARQAQQPQQQQPQTLKLTPQEYVVYERRNFETRFLPKRFFEEGQAFIERLTGEKAAFIDALFEESYQQKRMYPYLEEEFQVMVMDISDELVVVRVDMPNRDFFDGAALSVFFGWNPKTSKCRYVTIEKQGRGRALCEMTTGWEHINYGEAPAEGAELQRVIELLSTEGKDTV